MDKNVNCCVVGFKRLCEYWQKENPKNCDIKELTGISLEILKIAIFLQLPDDVLKTFDPNPMSYLEKILLEQFVVLCEGDNEKVKIVGFKDTGANGAFRLYYIWCAFVYTYVIKDGIEREHFLAYACLPHFLYKLQKFGLADGKALSSLLKRFPEDEKRKIRRRIKNFQPEKDKEVFQEQFRKHIEGREEFALLEMRNDDRERLQEGLVDGIVIAKRILNK